MATMTILLTLIWDYPDYNLDCTATNMHLRENGKNHYIFLIWIDVCFFFSGKNTYISQFRKRFSFDYENEYLMKDMPFYLKGRKYKNPLKCKYWQEIKRYSSLGFYKSYEFLHFAYVKKKHIYIMFSKSVYLSCQCKQLIVLSFLDVFLIFWNIKNMILPKKILFIWIK